MRSRQFKKAACSSLPFAAGLIAFSLLLLLATLTPAFAQEQFGSFIGTVTDPTAAMLPDVTVTIVNKGTGRELTTRTNTTGDYVFKSVEPGRYRLTFDREGFAGYQVEDALLLVGREIRVDARMEVASARASISVSETAPLIDTSGVMSASNITAQEFDILPKTRTFQSLINFTPNANVGNLESGYQINGASGAENAFFIDGVTTNSLIDGRSRQNVTFEFLQEVQVKTGGIDAEYGGALGGVVSAITKAGGNEFHGEAHYYYFGNAVSAGPVQRLFLYDQFGTGSSPMYVQDHKNQNDTHEIGGSIGGPIVKNKLFFFAGYTPQLVRLSNLYLFSNGTDPGTLTSSQTNQQLFSKMTAIPHQKVRINLSWLWTPTRTEGILPAYSAAGNASLTSKAGAAPNQTQGWTSPQNNYSAQVDFTLSPTAILTVRGGRFWDNYRNWGIPTNSSITFQTAPTGIVGLPPDLANAAPGWYNTPRTRQTFFDITTRSYFQGDFSKFIGHAWGSHDLKIGGGTTKGVNNVNISYPGGGYVFVYWNQAFRGQTGQYGYYEVDNQGTVGSAGGTQNNFYIQDHWRIHPRLTITLGFRAESENVPSFRPQVQKNGFSFGFSDKLSPRVGAAWDVLGSGKLKVFGSYGRLYQNVPYETARGAFGGDIWNIYYRSLDTLNVLSLSGTNMPGNNLWAGGAYRDRRLPSFDAVASGIKPMAEDVYTGGVEYQLAPFTVLRADYVGTRLIRTIEDLGGLDANGNEVYYYCNPGEGVCATMPTSSATPAGFKTPKPQRNYDAMELMLTRRFAHGFSGQASYVYSRLYGIYAGMANSDEITLPTSGVSSTTWQQSGGSVARPGSTATRAYDLDETLFDSHGKYIYGNLATDRPHMFKLYGNYSHPWGGHKGTSEMGLMFQLQSGAPYTTMVETVNQVQIPVNGRGDLGRMPWFDQTDLMVAHEFKLAEKRALRFEFNATNLFNQKTNLYTFNQINRGANTANAPQAGIDLSSTNLFNGFNYTNMLNAQGSHNSIYDPRFGMPGYFNTGFAGRFGVKFTF